MMTKITLAELQATETEEFILTKSSPFATPVELYQQMVKAGCARYVDRRSDLTKTIGELAFHMSLYRWPVDGRYYRTGLMHKVTTEIFPGINRLGLQMLEQLSRCDKGVVFPKTTKLEWEAFGKLEKQGCVIKSTGRGYDGWALCLLSAKGRLCLRANMNGVHFEDPLHFYPAFDEHMREYDQPWWPAWADVGRVF